jgi:hypothetical protein
MQPYFSDVSRPAPSKIESSLKLKGAETSYAARSVGEAKAPNCAAGAMLGNVVRLLRPALLGTGNAGLREKSMLTDAQRAAYDREGFIVVPEVFSAEDD